MVGIIRVEVNKRDLARLKLIGSVIPAIQSASTKVMRAEAKVVKNYMNMPASNWKKEHKPRWRTKSTSTTKRTSIDLATKSTPYIYIWMGTKIRYRKMTPDWQSKTKVRSLVPGPGRGSVAGRGVRPGIQAREWHVKVFQIREKIFERKLRLAIAGAIRPAFPGGRGISI